MNTKIFRNYFAITKLSMKKWIKLKIKKANNFSPLLISEKTLTSAI
jgi:hypothetical protein